MQLLSSAAAGNDKQQAQLENCANLGSLGASAISQTTDGQLQPCRWISLKMSPTSLSLSRSALADSELLQDSLRRCEQQ